MIGNIVLPENILKVLKNTKIHNTSENCTMNTHLTTCSQFVLGRYFWKLISTKSLPYLYNFLDVVIMIFSLNIKLNGLLFFLNWVLSLFL